MLTDLGLGASPAYAPGTSLAGMLKVNYVFGANGSGKTTLSRALAGRSEWACAQTWTSGIPLPIAVYNRDFVDHNFRPDASLKGVFTLGEQSQEAHAAIEEVTRKLDACDDKIAKFRLALDGAHAGGGKRGELADERERLNRSLFAARKSWNPGVKHGFAGYLNSAEKFAGKALEVLRSGATSPRSVDELLRAAASFTEDGSARREPLDTFDRSLLDLNPSEASLLATPIVASSDARLAALVLARGSSDWMHAGRHFFDPVDAVCPFCQQPTPESFASELEALFDARYEQEKAALDAVASRVLSGLTVLEEILEAAWSTPAPMLEGEAFETCVTSLRRLTSRWRRGLEKKREQLALPVVLPSMNDELATLVAMIDEANKEILRHNERIDNRARELARFKEGCWASFVHDHADSILKPQLVKIAALEKAIDGLQASIDDQTRRRQELERERTDREKGLVSSKPTIDAINEMLATVGFTSFTLAPSVDVTDGYTVIRRDGSRAMGTLSEGERTFIAFLYFLHVVRGRPSVNEEPRSGVVVIDDPISSLDSDVMFVVSSEVRRLADEVRMGTGRIRQLVVLTHNLYFHREITWSKTGTQASTAYFVIRKRAGQGSAIDRHERNPVRGSYARLWEEVRRVAAEGVEYTGVVGLQNVLRRILESYFRLTGGVDIEAAMGGMGANEYAVARSFLSWANDGSHSVVDDEEYTLADHTVDLYLRTFRLIFERMGHAAHYNMMIAEPTLSMRDR